jgi:dolichol-phosphate mannosyltransferase
MEMTPTRLEPAIIAATAAATPVANAGDRGALQLAIVLPTYNERANLRPLVAKLDATMGHISWEAIYVDDNSPDGTADEVRAIAQSDPRIRVIQRIGRRGLASAAIEGMLATSAPYVAVMDADLQHDPALLPQMLGALISGDYDLAYASRFAEGASTEAWNRPDRVKASGFANAIARKVTGVELSDPMSGYFMMPTASPASASRFCSIFWRPSTSRYGSRNFR